MSNMKLTVLTVLALALAACTPPAATPSPPAGATPEEVVAFYGAICTQEGIPDMSVEDAVAQGNARLAFAHQACIDGYVLEHVKKIQAGG
ncbi:hypothetical protein MWU60_14630 [Yoonia sp. F2084L]|uniref:hypothetical protein n=1 Tax=Yoonia sp. F2084L TaxID=2926419 RepID=UPI001FF2A905|nr:hypothetical protein [Yoonia sp. F2084L]MCK0096812.1 hypothetical protein [Yoonia sp. F2084L]